jgi:DNA-binding CsgD family transcriptional regulator
MRPKDVRECVEIVAAHPIVAPRYGDALADLRPAWLRLLSSNGFASAVVFEDEVDGARPRMLAVGIAVFASDDFLRELKTPPFFWIGPEIARRVARGDSPLLSEKQIRKANSSGGLNLVVWHASLRMEDVKRVEVWTELMTAFLDEHRGFLLNEMVAQGEIPEHLEGMRATGGQLLRPADGCYGDFGAKSVHDIVREPHISGFTRQMAPGRLGSWLGSMFLYQPPRFGFSRSEQRLLAVALAGGTDEELSDELGVSLFTIKKMWRSVYRRVSALDPDLIPSDAQAGGESSKRGRNKKQRLMAHLREHREELRPVSRKILEHSAAPPRRPPKQKTAL